MPEAGLLKRVKSWRSRRKDSQSSQLDALASPGSQLNSAQSRSQEPPTSSSSPVLVVKPSADFARRSSLDALDGFIRAGSDQHECGQSVASFGIPNSTGGYNASPEEFGIGLASSSPREGPLPQAIPKREDGERSIPSSPIQSPTIMRDKYNVDLGVQKRRRWKTFTGIFNRKDFSAPQHLVGQSDHSYQKKPRRNTEPESSVSLKPSGSSHYNLDAEDAAGGSQVTNPLLKSLPLLEPLSGEETGSRRQIGRRKSQFGRTHGKEREPAGNESRTWLFSHSSRKGPRPPPKNNISNRDGSLLNPENESFLQVEIPNFKMDRYSVMFSNLLPRDQSLSLLARRQARLAEIKLVPDERNKVDQFVSEMIPFSLKLIYAQISISLGDYEFPQSDQQTGLYSSHISSCVPTASPTSVKSHTRLVPLGPSPLFHQRLTVDADLVINSTAQASESKLQSHVMVLVNTPLDAPEEDASLDRSSSRSSSRLDIFIPPYSQTESSSPEPDGSAGSAGSLETNGVMPPISLTSTSTSRQAARQDDIRLPHYTIPRLAIEEQPANHATIEIAIARQVSVSKRQRQQLVPITPRQARQPKQPKLVNGEQDAKSRKSHYLIVEEP